MDIKKTLQLIGIKNEHLNTLKQDLIRLEGLVGIYEEKVKTKQIEEKSYLDGMRNMEAAGCMLLSSEMQASRGYLNTLNTQAESATRELADLNEQVENSRHVLNAAYTEVKLLERLVENNKDKLSVIDNRKNQSLADEQELMRFLRKRA